MTVCRRNEEDTFIIFQALFLTAETQEVAAKGPNTGLRRVWSWNGAAKAPVVVLTPRRTLFIVPTKSAFYTIFLGYLRSGRNLTFFLSLKASGQLCAVVGFGGGASFITSPRTHHPIFFPQFQPQGVKGFCILGENFFSGSWAVVFLGVCNPERIAKKHTPNPTAHFNRNHNRITISSPPCHFLDTPKNFFFLYA